MNEKQIAESKIFVSGRIKFIKDDPGRQAIGSFHPLTVDDRAVEAYIQEPQEHLCEAVICDDLRRIYQLLSLPGADINQRDYFGRTPLHVAVLNGNLLVVRILLDNGASCTARMNDGKIVTHVAATFGFDEILKLLLEKSEANERAAGERAKVQDTMNVDEEAVWEEIEIIEKVEVDQEEGEKVKQRKKDIDEELLNVIDVNIPDWDFNVSFEIQYI